MHDQYEITRCERGKNLTVIDVKLNADGGLTVFDWCCGIAPQMSYGRDDSESYVTLGPGAARELYRTLTGNEPETPNRDLAVLLQSTRKGDTKTQSWLRYICDQNDIAYEFETWP